MRQQNTVSDAYNENFVEPADLTLSFTIDLPLTF